MYLVIITTVTTVTYCCSSGKKTDDHSGEIREIHIDPESRQIGKLTLNELVESIEYIPLETTDDCLIGDITNSIFSENYMLLTCRITRRCYLFNRTGRFIAPIGNIGQGPGEYAFIPELLRIDEKNNQVVLATTRPQQLMYYRLNGEFIKSDSIEHFSSARKMSYHDGFYLIKVRNEGNTPYSYLVLNDDLKLVTENIKPVSFTMNPPGSTGGIGTPFCQYVYDSQVHIRENQLNDTLYRISSDFNFIPKYVFNLKGEISLEIRSDVNLMMREMRNLPSMNSIFEINDYLLFSYRFLQELNVPCYYVRSDDRLLYFSSSSGIPNDYDGGLDFWPQYQHNNQYISYHQVHLFEEHLERSDKLKPQGTSEVINRFEKISQKIDREDNPVMVVVIFKN